MYTICILSIIHIHPYYCTLFEAIPSQILTVPSNVQHPDSLTLEMPSIKDRGTKPAGG